MILFLFSIFNMNKLFSVVSPPTFHLAPRSLHLVFILQQRLAQNLIATRADIRRSTFKITSVYSSLRQLQKPRLLIQFSITSPIRHGFSAAARAIRWIVDIAMTFSERGCLLHFVNIGNYKFLFGIELNFKDEITGKLRNHSFMSN